jgi:hypothetical protein
VSPGFVVAVIGFEGREIEIEMIVSMGVVGSSVSACIACVVVTAAVMAER